MGDKLKQFTSGQLTILLIAQHLPSDSIIITDADPDNVTVVLADNATINSTSADSVTDNITVLITANALSNHTILQRVLMSFHPILLAVG